MSAPDPILPFGKYKGLRASEISDVRYLDWLIGQAWLKGTLRAQLEEHLSSRADWKHLDHDDD